MSTPVTTQNLQINILSKDDYDSINDKLQSELYIVKEKDSDGDYAIASRTYADVGRDAVIISEEAPDITKSRLWINPNDVSPEDVVYISPADTDLQNITDVAKTKIETASLPDYESSYSVDLQLGETWKPLTNGYIYCTVKGNSEVTLKYKTSSGPTILSLKSLDGMFVSNSIAVATDSELYVDMIHGSVETMFVPLKGVVNE